MVSVKNSCKLLIGAGLVLSLAFAGCDKLGTLFPSLKNKKAQEAQEAQQAQAPAVTESPAAPEAKDVLAKVGNWILTQQEFNDKIAILKKAMGDFDDKDFKNRQAILDELVRQQILVQDAEQKGLDKNKDVTTAVDEYRKTVLVQQVAKGLVENIQATDKDVEDFYNDKANEDLFKQPVQWHIREIVVADEAKANELLVSLAQGADFAEVAKANSISETAAKGGDVGLVADFEDPQVANTVLALEVGKTSGVFKGKKGYCIVKLEEKKGGDMEKLADIKAKPEEYTQLKDYVLAMKRQKAMADYVDAIKAKTSITINQDLLK